MESGTHEHVAGDARDPDGPGVQPALGRWFSPDDHRPGTQDTAILSNGYWQRRFGGDPEVIGRVMTIDSRPRAVIGVMPASSIRGIPADLILPCASIPCASIRACCPRAFVAGDCTAQAGSDAGSGQRRCRPDGRSLEASGESSPAGRPPAWSGRAPLKDDVVGDVGRVLWVLLGSISILLVIACANVANLLLVRAEGRGQELAVRTALGAGWGRIARAAGGEPDAEPAGRPDGSGGSTAGLRFCGNGPANLPRLNDLAIDLTVFAFALVTSLMSGGAVRVIPIAKTWGWMRVRGLREFVHGVSRWASAGRSQHRSQNALVVVQVALALVLLIGSGLMIRTFQMCATHSPDSRTRRPSNP